MLGLIAVAALIVAGCGGEEEERKRPRAAFDLELSRELVSQTDEINELLEVGDLCGAEDRAHELRQRVEELAGDREIDRRLSNPLLSGIDAAIGRIECVRQVTVYQTVEPPDDDEDDEDDDDGNEDDDGKRKERGRGRGRGGR